MSLFSKLEVSEFEEEDEQKEMIEDKLEVKSSMVDDEDILFETRRLCDKCQLAEDGNEDTSEVSLIAIDNEDQQEDVDEAESVAETNATQDMVDHDKMGNDINSSF